MLVQGESPGSGLALDADYAYYASASTIKRVPLFGGSAENLTDSAARIRSMDVDAETLAWSEESDLLFGQPTGKSSIKTMPKSGGTPATLVSNLNVPNSILLDSDFVFFSASAGSSDGSSTSLPGPANVAGKIARRGAAPVFYPTTGCSAGSLYSS